MHAPPLVEWMLVVLCAAAAAVCLVRREAGDEVVTSTGMAVMAVPVSVFDPWSWDGPLLAVVYALAVVRALLLSRHRAGHHLHHAVCAAAMVYMALSMVRAGPAHAGHAEHAAAGLPLLTGLLLLYFAGYVLRTGMLLVAAPARPPLIPALPAGPAPSARSAGPGASARPATSAMSAPVAAPRTTAGSACDGPAREGGAVPPRYAPEVAVACRVSMALAMFAMLLAL